MLATRKQINYLQSLADKAQYIKMRHPSVIPLGLMHQRFDIGITSSYASMLIDMYKDTLDKAKKILYSKSNIVRSKNYAR